MYIFTAVFRKSSDKLGVLIEMLCGSELVVGS